MWVPGSLFYLVPGALIMFTMLAPRDLARMPGRELRRNLAGQIP
jgi:hypothetical protein